MLNHSQDFRHECLEGSAIAPDVSESAIRFLNDIEFDELTKEVTATPIADALNWRYTRFGHQANQNRSEPFFFDEAGEIWQGKLMGLVGAKSGQYMAPKGIGDKPYFPPVPYRIALEIALKYEVTPPASDESFWSWILDNPKIPIVITEGAKKALSLISMGIPAIALYGCLCGAKTKDDNGRDIPLSLIPSLLPYAKGRKITIAFDRDVKPKAKQAVNKGLGRLSIAIKKAGGIPHVALWNQKLGKGIDDVASRNGQGMARGIIEGAISFETYRTNSHTQLQQVDRRVNERYLSLDSLAIPDDAQLIFVKSPKGTGKTECWSQIAGDATYRGIPVLAIGHRVKLMSELSGRLGIDYRTERTELSGLLGYALCIESLHPGANPGFNPDHWHGAIIFLDEIDQVIQSVLFSDTCKENRIAILETFRDTLRTILATGGKIYCSDADLSQTTIDFIYSLVGFPVKTWVVENEWERENPRDLTVYASKTTILSALLAHIEAGGRPYIVTGSQRKESKYSAQNLERIISVQTGKRSLVIDSETVSDPTHPAFRATDRLVEIIKPYDCLIVSPTLETGVSIEGSHYDSVWCFATGSQTVNGVCQAIERVRADVPRHIGAEKIRNPRYSIGNGSDNPNDLIRGERKKSSFTFKQLSELDCISAYEGENTEYLSAWASYGAILNCEGKRYRGAILEKLVREGYRIIPHDPNGGESSYAPVMVIETMVTLTRDEAVEQEQEAIAATPNPDDLEYARLKEKRERTPEHRLSQKKGKLCRRYLTEEITPEMIKRDSEGWFSQLTLHYYLTTGKPFLKDRDTKKVKALGESGKGKIFSPDVNRTALTPLVACLEFLGIDRFLDPDTQWSNDSLKEWWETMVLPYRRDIKTLTGITIGEKDSPIRFAQRLLGKMGLKLACIGRLGKRGDRTRFYRLSAIDPDGRWSIFARWFERENAGVSTGSINIYPMPSVDTQKSA
jgi:hypothetical protein